MFFCVFFCYFYVLFFFVFFFFFFSSRRRHTRLTCDWSSDVCSSDLVGLVLSNLLGPAQQFLSPLFLPFNFADMAYCSAVTLNDQMLVLARQAKAASRALAKLSTADKNACLLAMADALDQSAEPIKAANALDMQVGAQTGLSSAMLDRLKLDDKRLAAMGKGLREVAALPDPVGRLLDERVRPNGVKLQKVSTPIGVVVIIYESRPNVIADAASRGLKSGNADIRRGGK